MHPRRLERMNELLRQTISKFILSLNDPGIGFMTITSSKLAPDLSSFKVMYSVLGSDEDRENTAQALVRATPVIRREIAKLENLKKIPQLTFVYDDGAERADRVYRILDSIHNEKKPNDNKSTDPS